MLYPDPNVVLNKTLEENISSDDEDEFGVGVSQRKKPNDGNKNCKKHSNGSFSSTFKFEFSDIREIEDQEKNMDGLRLFLKQNSMKSAHTEAESDCVVRLDDEHCDFTEEDLLLEMPEIEDRLDEKALKKKKAKNVDSDFFDLNSESFVNANGVTSFDKLNLSRPILKAISEAAFLHPTKIQSIAIPVALEGKDICACSATGSGKTAAFMIPILERLLYRHSGQKSITRVLVLVPTRELAIQVFQVSRKLAKYVNVDICLSAGGLDVKVQEAALRLEPDIVIATPGRLIYHLHNAPNFSLSDIEVLVLDEADRLLEDSFADQLKELIFLCSKNRQTMLFSATMTDKVDDLANVSLKKPVRLFVNENTDISLNLRQEFIKIRKEREFEREAVVSALVTRTFNERSIVFLRTKRDCQYMQNLLKSIGVKAGQLHGGMSQLERVEMLCLFKNQKNINVLCATDLAARGLDIDGVKTIINMHMPSDVKNYVHRVGRTARAGKVGRSISLVGEQDRKLFKQIMKSSGDSILMQRKISYQTISAYVQRILSVNLRNEGSTTTNSLPRSKFERNKCRERKGQKQKQKIKRPLARKSQDDFETNFTSDIVDISKTAVKRLQRGPDDPEYRSAKIELVKKGVIKRVPKK